MSRPRKPFGPNPPGRLPATVVKVLAAELADPGRLTRGKRYWADDAVVDIVIGHGSVTGEVQGSRRDPYVVTIDAEPGRGVPNRRELWLRCTCPDDTGTGGDACKHAVAVLFALSDEIAIEPAVIDRWRAGRGRPPAVSEQEEASEEASEEGDEGAADDAERGNVIAFPRGRRSDERSSLGGDDAAGRAEIDDRRREADEISAMLRAPTGAVPADLPTPERWAAIDVRDPIIGPLLDDALDHLQIRWE